MNISPARITAPLSILAQWIAVEACIFANKTGIELFSYFSAELPSPTVWAVRLSGASVLVPVAITTTLAIILAEVFVKSERSRFTIQVLNLMLWLVFTAFVLAALFYPLDKSDHVIPV